MPAPGSGEGSQAHPARCVLYLPLGRHRTLGTRLSDSLAAPATLFHQGERAQGTWLLQHGRGGWGGEKGDRLEAHSPNPRSRVCGHGWACQNQSRMRLRSA